MYICRKKQQQKKKYVSINVCTASESGRKDDPVSERFFFIFHYLPTKCVSGESLDFSALVLW